MPKDIYASGDVKVGCDTTGLDNLMEGIKENYIVRVGILGSKGLEEHHRKETGTVKAKGGHRIGKEKAALTNAEIGLRHERGVKSEHLPQRSWLVTPLEDNLSQYMNVIGAETINKMIQHQAIRAYQELAIVCEQIVLKGFETGGFGKWKPLSAFTISQKKSSQILVDTAQLKKSTTAEVVKI